MIIYTKEQIASARQAVHCAEWWPTDREVCNAALDALEREQGRTHYGQGIIWESPIPAPLAPPRRK